jgi:hypothetical protein
MESKDPVGELRTLAQLQTATKVESRRMPKWSAPVGAVALVAFLLAARVHPLPATAGWIAFIVLWVVFTRRGVRATPLPALSRTEAVAFVSVGVVALVVFGTLVSSAAAGLASGAVGAAAGALSAWRGSHQ